MKNLAWLLLLSLTALPRTALAGPIVITGSGSFSDDLEELSFDWDVSFSGTNGASSVFAFIACGGPGAAFPLSGGFLPGCDGSQLSGHADVDGTAFSDGFDVAGPPFTFGGSSITGENSSDQPVVTEALTSYVIITSESYDPGQYLYTGTFDLVATPEPGTLCLTFVGLALGALARRGIDWRRSS